MRLHRGVPMLAAVITMAGLSTPAASGLVRAGSSGSGPSGQPTAVAQPHSGDSIDWVIGIGTAGGLTVLGTGLAAKRYRGHKRQHIPVVPAS